MWSLDRTTPLPVKTPREISTRPISTTPSTRRLPACWVNPTSNLLAPIMPCKLLLECTNKLPVLINSPAVKRCPPAMSSEPRLRVSPVNWSKWASGPSNNTFASLVVIASVPTLRRPAAAPAPLTTQDPLVSVVPAILADFAIVTLLPELTVNVPLLVKSSDVKSRPPVIASVPLLVLRPSSCWNLAPAPANKISALFTLIRPVPTTNVVSVWALEARTFQMPPVKVSFTRLPDLPSVSVPVDATVNVPEFVRLAKVNCRPCEMISKPWLFVRLSNWSNRESIPLNSMAAALVVMAP